ncbi:MAG: hypothetical protein WCF16_08910 [Alphaproteobacteria bacterium]
MAEFKIKYAARAALALTLASLATDSNLLTGRASDAVSNTSNLFDDVLIGGKITVGTTPTANTFIEVWAYAARQDAPSYPDAITGSDAGKTMTSAAIKQLALSLIAVIPVDSATSDRAYPIKETSIASLFGGVMPDKWGVFVTHNTGVNLNATAGNHFLEYMGISYTSA